MQLPPFDHYAGAFAAHTHEFFTGTPVSVVPDSELAESEDESTTRYDSRVTPWSGREKDQFFEFLGRYGIENVEKIQEKVKTKSVPQIIEYHDTLQEAANHYKKKKHLFRKLIQYQDFPAALEVDEMCVSLEEEFSAKLQAMQPQITPDLSHEDEEDEEDELIDFSRLAYNSKLYYSFKHLNPTGIAPMPLPKEVKQYFNQLIRDIVTMFIKQYIYFTLFTSTPHLRIVDSEGKKARGPSIDNPQDFMLSFFVSLRMTFQCFMDLGLRRPQFFHTLLTHWRDKLDIEFYDTDGELPPERQDGLYVDSEGRNIFRIVKGFINSYSQLYASLTLKKFSSTLDNKLTDEFLLAEQTLNEEVTKTASVGQRDVYEQNGHERNSENNNNRKKSNNQEHQIAKTNDQDINGKDSADGEKTIELDEVPMPFITDDPIQSTVLDNDTAWFLLSNETEDCDVADFIDHESKQFEYLQQFGMAQHYAKLCRLLEMRNPKPNPRFRRENANIERIRKIGIFTARELGQMKRKLRHLKTKIDQNPEDFGLRDQLWQQEKGLEMQKQSIRLFYLKLRAYQMGLLNKIEDDQDIETKIFNNGDTDYHMNWFLEELKPQELPQDKCRKNDEDEDESMQPPAVIDDSDDSDYAEESDARTLKRKQKEENLRNEHERIRNKVWDSMSFTTGPNIDKDVRDKPQAVLHRINAFEGCGPVMTKKGKEHVFEITPEMQTLYSYARDD